MQSKSDISTLKSDIERRIYNYASWMECLDTGFIIISGLHYISSRSQALKYAKYNLEEEYNIAMGEVIAKTMDEYISHCERSIQELLSLIEGVELDPESMRSIKYNILSYNMSIIRVKMSLIKTRHCA